MRSTHAQSHHLAALTVVLILGPVATVTAEAGPSDQATERYLRKAEVTRIHMFISATTYPMSVDLERKGEVRKALFKYGNSQGPPLDSYLHEVAAYRLDRALDLHMVPVAVLREVKEPGALIEWISPAVSLQKLRETGDLPGDPQRLLEQQAVMRVFDTLILNLDRKESDQLVSPEDSSLYLIDHSRAFQTTTDLPESFASQPCQIPRSLERKLEKLEAKPLEILFKGLLNEAQIQAMLERRDLILAKIEADRQQLGDQAVYLD
jgi:hypothetical protein